jgi:VanZ family protein
MNLLRYIPMITFMGIIFFLSSQPGYILDLPDIDYLDKGLHAIAYGALGLAVLFGIPEEMYLATPYRISMLVVLFCLLYGISDEFHQSFVPGRFPSISDLVADTIGGIMAVSIWFTFMKRTSHSLCNGD